MIVSTNPWMDDLARMIDAEGILKNPDDARLVPAQFYARTLAEFFDQMQSLVRSSGWEKRRIAVFVDGFPKQSSEGRDGTIDNAFQCLLQDMGLAYDWIDLSSVLGLPSADIHSSHTHMDKIRGTLHGREKDICIVLGSGTVTDLVKHSLFLEGYASPLISVPTALTVTAFTSAFSIIDFHGAKRTQVSREVTATFWAEPFLRCAPTRMSRAGFGDLLARFVAYGDWYLGYRLGVMKRYDERAYRLMEPFVPGIRTSASGFGCHPLPAETTACTAAALAMAGIAMSTAGETTPLSGYEHVISHALDFLNLLSGRELVFHGEQVALGSLISARTIDWLLALPSVSQNGWRVETAEKAGQSLSLMMDRIPLADVSPMSTDDSLREKLEAARQEFAAEYEKKSSLWRDASRKRQAFPDDWKEIRRNLARLTLRTDEMEKLLKQSGLPLRPEYTYPPTSVEAFHWAVSFAPFVRSRMNIADLIYWLGKDPAFILASRQ